MTVASAGTEVNALLLERYPDLFFLLQYTVFKEVLPLSKKSQEEAGKHLSLLDASRFTTIYVYGLASGFYYEALKTWLHEDKKRRLIFLEESLGAIRYFLDDPLALSFFADPQVILHTIPEGNQLAEVILQLVSDYPCNQVEVIAHPAYQGDRFDQLRLELLRQSVIAHSLETEVLQYHRLLINVVSNIKAWHLSFFASGLKGKFKNIPAVICGAGPSLKEHFSDLKELEDRALLIAGGSTITALSNQGIIPHLGMAFDPNPEEFERIKYASAYEMPLIYGTRLQSRVLATLNGEKGYLVSQTGGACENHFEKALNLPRDAVGLELSKEALSVTTLAISLAVHMGCNPIILNGIDLCYNEGQRYAPGVMPNSFVAQEQMETESIAGERHLKRLDIEGRPVSTLVKWVMESECIADFAAKHPSVRFINVSQQGLGFKGIVNCQLKDVIREDLQPSLDLRALVHAEIQHLKLSSLKEPIEKELELMTQSLHRLLNSISSYLEELKQIENRTEAYFPSAKLVLLELDLVEEPAFACFNHQVGPVLERLCTRFFPLKSQCSEEEKKAVLFQRQLTKFSQWKEIIQEQLDTLELISEDV